MTWGSPASQLDTLRKLGRMFPEDSTDLVVVVHAACGNPIARLVSAHRPRWLWGPVLVSREPTEVPPGGLTETDDIDTDIDTDDTGIYRTIDFFQLVQGLTIPGRLDLWCAHCRRHDEVQTKALRAAAKRATPGTLERVRTVTAG